MQSLAAENSAPKAKRRKLDHAPDPELAKEDENDDQDELKNAEDADRVEEAEEGPETATDGLLEDDADEEDSLDPFESHFASPDDNVLARRLKALQLNQWSTQKTVIPKLGKVMINIPLDADVKPPTIASISGPAQLKLKQKLADAAKKLRPAFDHLEMSFAPLLFGYQDLLYCERTPVNSESLRRLTCLHAVNHVFK